MRVTNPYDNEITVVNNFVTEEEIEMALRYFNKFFNKGQSKESYQANSDTADFFQLSTAELISDEEYEILKPQVRELFNQLQTRAEEFFPGEYEFTPLYNFSRLMGKGISQHADDLQDGATQKVFFGSILYWNGDFEGGELNYTNLGIKYKPVAGDFVFHPGTVEYTHGVEDVTSGIRYTSTMFIKGIDAIKP